MPTKTPNERRRWLAGEYADQYRQSFVADFTRMTDGWGVELRDELLQFFSEETTPGYWLALREADDQNREKMAAEAGVDVPTLGRMLAAAAERGDEGAQALLMQFAGEAAGQLRQWRAAREMKRGTPESKGEA